MLINSPTDEDGDSDAEEDSAALSEGYEPEPELERRHLSAAEEDAAANAYFGALSALHERRYE